MNESFSKWYFIRTQLMRVHLKIQGNDWEIEGVPSLEAMPSDELLLSQLDWFKILAEHDLHEIDFFDYLFWPFELIFGWIINRLRHRKPWKYSGVSDQEKV